jgi:hypothetical protein
MSVQTRAARFAEEFVAANREFMELVGSLSDEQWRLVGKNFPQRANEEDERRSVGVIAYHVADAEQFIVDRIYLMLEGKPMRQFDFRDLNAKQATRHAEVTRDEVLSLLRANEERIPPRIRAIPDDALDVVHETPAGPATVAQRLERVLIGHLKMHQGSIEAAVRRA